jgi:hypothetical protein
LRNSKPNFARFKSSFLRRNEARRLALYAGLGWSWVIAGCAGGSGRIGDALNDSDPGSSSSETQSGNTEDAWQRALAATEDALRRSALKLAEVMQFEAEAEAADARGDTAAAQAARQSAARATEEAEALARQVSAETSAWSDQLRSVQTEVTTLQTQLTAIQHEQDPLSLTLRAKLAEKQQVLEAIDLARARITELRSQVWDTRWQISLRRAYTDGHASRRSNWRVGIGGNPSGLADRQDLRYLGWYFNWQIAGDNAHGFVPERGWHFVNLVAGYSPCLMVIDGQCRTDLPLPEYQEHLRHQIDRYPHLFPNGTIFTVGNENEFDDGRDPLAYANAHCGVYKTIKAINPDFLVATGATIPTSWYYFLGNSPVRAWSYLNASEQQAYQSYLLQRTGQDLVSARLQQKMTAQQIDLEASVWNGAPSPKPDWLGLHYRIQNRITGLEYWDAVQASVPSAPNCQGFSKLPVDVYNLHLYPWHDHASGKTNDAARVIEGVRRFRERMNQWGERDKPLIITELGTGNQNGDPGFGYAGPASGNWPSYNSRSLAGIMDALFSATDANVGMPSDGNRVAQRWAWFMLTQGMGYYEGQWTESALYDYKTGNEYPQPTCMVMQPGGPCVPDPGIPYDSLAKVYRDKSVQHMPGASAYHMSTERGPMGLSQEIRGGLTYSNAEGRKTGKTVEFFARVACAPGAQARWVLNRRGPADWEQRHTVSSSATCNGTWQVLRLTYQVPNDTTGLRVWVELSGSGTIRALVDDAHAEAFEKPVLERTLGERGQELLRNTGFEFDHLLSTSMGKTNPGPWWVIAPNGFLENETKVVPWRQSL